MSLDGMVIGRCDAGDRLIEADGPLAGLQQRCGGDLPGLVAVPALLALVRQARHASVALSRTLGAIDDGKAIVFHARAAPDGDGTRVELSQWRLAGEPGGEPGRIDATGPDRGAVPLLHQMAAIRAVLDSRMGVLTAGTTSSDPALAALVARWLAAPGEVWTEAVALEGVAHRQPLHWRLLHDVALRIPDAPGLWRAALFPRAGLGGGDHGFDLLITPEMVDAVPPDPDAPPVTERAEPAMPWGRLIGRDLAPALRQPINRIIANAETIRTRLAGPLPGEYADYANDIAEAGRHLLALVEDLADLEAVEAPGFAPAPDRIDLADCARRAAGILGVRAQERGIRLVAPPEDDHAPAVGEFRRVLQILLNLLTNAIRYSPAHSTVTIAVGQAGTKAWIAVSDEGEGLSPEQAARVFDKFERLGRTGDGGSGLGLYISRRLARAMGGDLIVSGRSLPEAPGQGACFVLSLPAP